MLMTAYLFVLLPKEGTAHSKHGTLEARDDGSAFSPAPLSGYVPPPAFLDDDNVVPVGSPNLNKRFPKPGGQG